MNDIARRPDEAVHAPADPPRRGFTRRTFLRAAAVGTVIVAGGLVWRADEQGLFARYDGPAFDAWHASGSDPTSALAAAAVLAASAHNMQNWHLRLGATRIELFDDTQRSLGSVDPFRREAHLGLGCALANLELAGPPHGRAVQVTLATSASVNDPVATVDLTPTPARGDDPLFRAIPNRHSDRGHYPDGSPDAGLLAALTRTAVAGAEPVEIVWLTEAGQLADAGRLLVDTAQALTDDDEMSRDNDAWFRNSRQVIDRSMDGLTLDGQALSPLIELAGTMLPPVSRSRSDATWVQLTRDVHTATARAYGLVIAPRGDLSARLCAGRAIQRLHLALTSEGWAMQHLNQAVEMVERDESTGRQPRFASRLADLAAAGEVIAMVRTGRPSGRAVPSPRRPYPLVVA
jgi:hypothetical protein